MSHLLPGSAYTLPILSGIIISNCAGFNEQMKLQCKAGTFCNNLWSCNGMYFDSLLVAGVIMRLKCTAHIVGAAK